MLIKILCVAGARPNFIKIAPVLRALSARRTFAPRLVHTGQHYDDKLSRVFFEDLGIPKPDIELGVGSGSHATQSAELMRRFEPVLHAEQPHAVLVVGDVNSTIACALVTSKFQLAKPFRCSIGQRRRPLMIHVEAGLRSFDDDMPEEINRRLTDALSEVLFVSEPAGVTNLAREGIVNGRVHFVGNVMIDSLLAVKDKAMRSGVLDRLGLQSSKYGLVTLHRPGNVDDPGTLLPLLAGLDRIAAPLPLVFPVHPRTHARLHGLGISFDPSRWTLTEPVGYLDFVKLMACARIVLTDSGGIQEETTVLGVRCITLRDTTERPCTAEQGTNILAGTIPEGIYEAFTKSLELPVGDHRPQLWDGRAAERIAVATESIFSEG